MFRITSESHTDHNLTLGHLGFIKRIFAERTSFFAEVVEIPAHLSSLPSALHGPLASVPLGSEAPVPESEVYYDNRGQRTWLSRMVRRAPRMVRSMVVIAGPSGRHDGSILDRDVVLYTAYGGLVVSPRESADTSLKTPEEKAEAEEFWKVHALNPES